MSLHSAEPILMDALKQLRLRWERVRDQWDDPASRQIQAEFIEPLEPMVRNALRSLDQTVGILDRARRECADD